jgi:hypothetical protein
MVTEIQQQTVRLCGVVRELHPSQIVECNRCAAGFERPNPVHRGSTLRIVADTEKDVTGVGPVLEMTEITFNEIGLEFDDGRPVPSVENQADGPPA